MKFQFLLSLSGWVAGEVAFVLFIL